jgi:small subunit ribosomal protein S8
MSMTDPIGDFLTRIRNALRVGFKTVDAPASKLKVAVAEALKREGYIRGYFTTEKDGKAIITVELKYVEEQPAIRRLDRVSTPGRRVYFQIADLPKIANGLGVSILSTSKGVMSDNEARAANVGGEVLCQVF